MIVRWETEDLTEIVLKLLPAYIDLVSIKDRYESFSHNGSTSHDINEAICSTLMNFFLENCPCSLVLIQDGNDLKNSSNHFAYWVTTTFSDHEIVLSYQVILGQIIQNHLS